MTREKAIDRAVRNVMASNALPLDALQSEIFMNGFTFRFYQAQIAEELARFPILRVVGGTDAR